MSYQYPPHPPHPPPPPHPSHPSDPLLPPNPPNPPTTNAQNTLDPESWVKFVVGSSRVKFHVRVRLLSWLSPTLNRDMLSFQSGNKETCPSLNLPPVGEDTFVRLCEFAFLKTNYSVPEPRYKLPLPADQDGTGQSFLSNTSRFEPKELTPAELLEKRNLAHADRLALRELCPEIPMDCLREHEPYRNTPSQDFSEVFKAHADVFIVAQIYEIERLKIVVLNNLEGAFVTLTMHPLILENLANLAWYAYRFTPRGAPDQRSLFRVVDCFLVWDISMGRCQCMSKD
ncbi:hypothetical protein P170DRAFT_426524 [Aspergillus steynii IBT 23096]|uniref:BTB domain-containing protein n=1 Tax=Aspergillus steynii IBT 23096 TaxID=1392250 RepID=A0A2I2G9U5_9EURO|nr:uncharacterized protein P170DRAFT_426524 [Aspergillus steynii IBT 23096]PLB49646.1 hypothetical protein P170DRAFT_426524 [Aspergillus steynii IBT 23096]